MPLTPFEKKTQVLQLGADLPSRLVADHLKYLDSDYFNEFTPQEIILHLEKIRTLKIPGSFALDFVPLDDLNCGLTIIGEDLPGFFAALTGLIASYDFDIRIGKVFTYSKGSDFSETAEKSGREQVRILDYLVLQHAIPGILTDALKTKIGTDLDRLIQLLKSRQTQELQLDLYRRMGDYLSRNASKLETSRLPLDIHYEYDDKQTVLTVSGTDHKALLFSLSNALMLQGVSIQKLLTTSEADRFEDRIYITDSQSRPIANVDTLERLKVAIILMERFTSTLPQASDYPAAVQTFNAFINTLMENTNERPDLPTFEDFSTLSTLAKLLSAGPYLWEELIKIPMPDLIEILRDRDERQKFSTREELDKILALKLVQQPTYPEKVLTLNRFKDLQLFRLDVVYLIHPHKTLQEFSGELSDLADVILENAMWIGYDHLRSIYGEPMAPVSEGSQASPCHFGLFAQGKLGGRELGYASDLELQMLYGNSGETVGTANTISHAEFFSLLVQEIRILIVARKDGIFELDLRLRPHGDAGPLATTVDSWVAYYGEDGGALEFESQALLKLRPIAATPGFASRVMGARDALVFGERKIGIDKTLLLRAKQIELKANNNTDGTGLINAKYAPGGLVEIEYAVQFLQLQHGRRISSLREANTEKALEVLLAEGILSPEEFEKLYHGYVFLRRLINALRMVHGHSRDLWVPAQSTPEFQTLAKRMGYLPTARFQPDSQMAWDLKQTLRKVRSVFASRFQGSTELDSDATSLTAIFLDPAATTEQLSNALDRLGVHEVASPQNLIDTLFKNVKEKGLLCAALVVSESRLRASPDPVGVLQHLGEFLEVVPDADYFIRQMLNHPHLHAILIKAFGHSEYLTQILLQQPEYLLALGTPRALEKPKLWSEFQNEIKTWIDIPVAEAESEEDDRNFDLALENLRRYRNREYLRIGLRDIFLGEPLQRITAEISQLTNALVHAIFKLTMVKAGTDPMAHAMAIIALGKLGGNELNYSSDIDIVFLYDADKIESAQQVALEAWARLFVAAASEPGLHGKLFRIDAQLRPYGLHSPLIGSITYFREYYQNSAAGWELQSWLKARPLVGNFTMASEMVEFIQRLAVSPLNREKIEVSMQQIRKLGLEKLRQEDRLFTEVKLGPGGIRTIEFYAQYQQILHGQDHPELISGNTLSVLGRLFRYRLISHTYYDLLSKSYTFLRRIEHVLQLQGLQQRHELPTSPDELEKLSKRMGFEERAGQTASSQFRSRYRQHMLPLLEVSSALFAYETNIPGESEEKK